MKTIYIHPKCSTCLKAKKWLDQEGIPYKVEDIREVRPDLETMRAIKEANHLTVKNMFNTSGELYKEMGLKDKLDDLTDDQALEILLSDGMLIRRPLLVDGTKATFGFKEETYSKLWG